MNVKLLKALVLSAACAAPLAASGSVYEYSYLGNWFDLGDNLGGKISMQIYSNIAPTASYLSLADVISFTITDVTTKITKNDYNPNSSGVDLSFAGGVVSEWDVILWDKASGIVLSTANYSDPLTRMDSSLNYAGGTGSQVLNYPGSWQVSTVPEPESALLWSTGIVLLGARLWRKSIALRKLAKPPHGV